MIKINIINFWLIMKGDSNNNIDDINEKSNYLKENNKDSM